METQVRTPSAIFGQPQPFCSRCFKSPMCGSQEQQWAPLWDDLERVASRLLQNPNAKHEPDFPWGCCSAASGQQNRRLPERTVIDGQQRLTNCCT